MDVFNQSLFPKASENGTIQLYKKMQAENLAREAEIAELRAKLERYFRYYMYIVYILKGVQKPWSQRIKHGFWT